MLQLATLRERTDYVLERLSVKNVDAKSVVDRVLGIDENRRKVQTELDQLLNQQNTIAKQVGELYKSGKKAEGDDLKNKSAALKQTVAELSERLTTLEHELNEELVKLPNMPSERVPRGRTPEDNEVVHQEGIIPTLTDDAQPHWELASKYDIIDFELGVKLTGAGFPVYKRRGARLQRA
ncbi:MAG: serine--tRNA ligase, partial [Bacteroidota bacterium]